MRILDEEAQLDLHGVPGAAVEDLPLSRVALGIVLQERHHLRPHGFIHTAGHTNIQEHLQPNDDNET